MSFYVATYVERDLRLMINVKDLSKFEIFFLSRAAQGLFKADLPIYTNISLVCRIFLDIL